MQNRGLSYSLAGSLDNPSKFGDSALGKAAEISVDRSGGRFGALCSGAIAGTRADGPMLFRQESEEDKLMESIGIISDVLEPIQHTLVGVNHCNSLVQVFIKQKVHSRELLLTLR